MVVCDINKSMLEEGRRRALSGRVLFSVRPHLFFATGSFFCRRALGAPRISSPLVVRV